MSDAIWREVSFASVVFKISQIFYLNNKKLGKSPFLELSKKCYSDILIYSLSRIIKQQKDSCSIFKIGHYIDANVKNIFNETTKQEQLRQLVKKISEIKNTSLCGEIEKFRDNTGAHISLKHAKKGQSIKLVYNIEGIGKLIDHIDLVLNDIYVVLGEVPLTYYKGDFGEDLKKIIDCKCI